MTSAIKNYFSEFLILKTVVKEFWLINAINFFYSISYFSLMNVFTLYLTSNCGFSDVDSGAWVGIYTLYVTAFVFAVGSVCDTIGLKKTLFIGSGSSALSCLIMGLAPIFFKGYIATTSIMFSIVLLSFGTAFLVTAVSAALRCFTSETNRSTGFNVYYLIMNIAAIISGFGITDGFRRYFGELRGNSYIVLFGALLGLLSLICVFFINENNRIEKKIDGPLKRPLAIFTEVWKEKSFQKLVIFLLITIGVRIIFANQFLVMPKYYTRVLHSDFELGLANSINPFIIVFGLIILIPIINKYDTFKLVVLGMTISALSLLFMALPINWILMIPGIHNLDNAYYFVIFSQILIFSFGELIFSPRFTEYTSTVAPKDKVASYMSLSALPMFIAKPINGFISGLLISSYSFEGIRAKIDSGNITYKQSPEYMWLIYFIMAILSPLLIILLRNFLRAQPQATGTLIEEAAE